MRSGQERPDPVTQRILRREWPKRDEFQQQTGSTSEDLYDALVAVYGLSFGLTNHSKQHAPVHYFDTANSWYFRRDESGLKLCNEEVIDAMSHDGEDIGKLLARKNPKHTLATTYVVIDVLNHLLSKYAGPNFGNRLHLQAPEEGLLFDPVSGYLNAVLEGASVSEVSMSDVSKELERLYARYRITERQIRDFYDAIIDRWQRICGDPQEGTMGIIDADKHKHYLRQDERDYIKKSTLDLIARSREKRDADPLKPRDLKEAVMREFEDFRTLIRQGELLDVPEALVLPQHSELVVRIAQTIYARYIQKIDDAVVAGGVEAMRAGYPNGDRYLGPGVIKRLDGRDTVSRMGPTIDNMASIYGKQTLSLPMGSATAQKLAASNIPNERYVRALMFDYCALVDRIEELRRHFGVSKKRNTTYSPERKLLDFMYSTLNQITPPRDLRVVPFVPKGKGRGKASSSARTLLRNLGNPFGLF